MLTRLHRVGTTGQLELPARGEPLAVLVDVDSTTHAITMDRDEASVWSKSDGTDYVVRWMLGCLKHRLLQRHILSETLRVSRASSDSVEVTNSEWFMLRANRQVVFAPPDALRMAYLEFCYDRLEEGHPEVCVQPTSGAPSLLIEGITKETHKMTMHYLLQAKLLSPVDHPSLTLVSLTADGIRYVEQFRRLMPSSSLGFGVLAFRHETNALWQEGIDPALRGLRLQPVRVDATAQIDPLINGIQSLIRTADLIVADLTFARPNCYYEIGWAHALRKRIVLSVRRDRFKQDVCFDVAPYQVVMWNDGDFAAYRSELMSKAKELLDGAALP